MNILYRKIIPLILYLNLWEVMIRIIFIYTHIAFIENITNLLASISYKNYIQMDILKIYIKKSRPSFWSARV